MKRFFSILVFLFLLLCSQVSYAQEKAQPPADASPVVTADEGNKEAKTAPQNAKTDASNQDERPTSVNSALDDRMAKIAQEANNWAMGQTVIGGIGLIFVVAATIFAGLAWRAGRDAVKVTREIGEAQVRGYGVIKSAEFFLLNDIFDVNFIIENVGNSPIITCSLKLQVFLKDPSQTEPESFFIPKYVKGMSKTFDIGPAEIKGQTAFKKLHFPSQKDIPQPHAFLQNSWYLMGEVIETDVFNSVHRYKFKATPVCTSVKEHEGLCTSVGKLVISEVGIRSADKKKA